MILLYNSYSLPVLSPVYSGCHGGIVFHSLYVKDETHKQTLTSAE